MPSSIGISLAMPQWNVVLPPVVRYLDATYVDEFLSSGRLRIPTFKRFWENENDELGDEFESLVRVHGVAGDGSPFNGAGVNGADALVLSTSCVEDLALGARLSSGYTSAFRITDTVAFAAAVAASVPRYRGGFQGYCIYRDSKLVVLHDFASHYPTLRPPNNELEAQAFVNGLNRYVAERVTMNALFRKPLKYREQNEYRFIWLTPDAGGKDYLDVECSDAIRFCERVEATPQGPDMTVNILGAHATVMTRFDPSKEQ